MDTKNFLTSKTILGLIVIALSLALPRFGIRLPDDDLNQIATLLMQALGALGVIVGRITASKGITLGKADSGATGTTGLALLLTISLGLGLTACAIKPISQMTGPEQARVAAQELMRTWQGAYEQYTALEPTLTPEQRAQAQATIAPAINRAKPVVLAAASAANLWTLTAQHNATGAQEVQDIAAQAGSMLTQALNLIQQIRR